MAKNLTIGSKVFLVHTKYAFKEKPGGSVVLGKVAGYRNVNGIVEAVFRQIGQPKNSPDLTLKHWIPFLDIDKAIDSISTTCTQKSQPDSLLPALMPRQ